MNSLSDHYNSPGQLAEYKRQSQRAFRRPGDDPSIFAIELETLARRAFVDIDPLIQLQMVRDRFIDGHAECALHRHLDSLGPDTPMADIVERRAEGRSAVKRIPDGTVLRRDNQWGIPRKHALFVSDGPDSTTSGSDILEGHYDRPPEEGYYDAHSTGRPHDVQVAEELCSPSEHLKKQWSGCSKTLQINARSSNLIGHRLRRSLLGLRNGRGLRRRQFLEFQGS